VLASRALSIARKTTTAAPDRVGERPLQKKLAVSLD